MDQSKLSKCRSLDPQLLVVGLTQTCFEGSMYLFVFLWVPSLQESSTSSEALPLGYIFSCFMIAMMLGSLLYTSVISFSQRPSTHPMPDGPEEPLMIHAKLSSLVCAASALSFAVTITCKHDEHMRFWAFCAFEACVGMYYPVQGMLRGSLISNEHRATVSLMHIGRSSFYSSQ
jgi:MFS transporter, MFS domain-containing protein family, molybdate-anion transporter